MQRRVFGCSLRNARGFARLRARALGFAVKRPMRAPQCTHGSCRSCGEASPQERRRGHCGGAGFLGA